MPLLLFCGYWHVNKHFTTQLLKHGYKLTQTMWIGLQIAALFISQLLLSF